jgi:hypothetical protein
LQQLAHLFKATRWYLYLHLLIDSIATEEHVASWRTLFRPVGVKEHPIEGQLKLVRPLDFLVGFDFHREQRALRGVYRVGPPRPLNFLVGFDFHQRRQVPSNCRVLSFAVEWPEVEDAAEPKSAHRARRTAGALGYRVLSGSEILYRLSPKKRTGLRR